MCCGLEICCLAAGAAGCYGKGKIDEVKKKKKKGATKGGQETYTKATAKKENKNPKSNKTVPKRDSKSPEPRKSRMTAYEEYAQKESSRAKSASSPPPQHIHRRPSQPDHDTPKGGVMDAEEFSRLKSYNQAKERSRW